MSDHIQSTIDQLQIELEALDQKRSDIEHAIGALTRLAREGLTTNGHGTDGTPSRKRSTAAAPVTREKRSASSKAPAAVDQELQEIGDRIVTALRAKSPQRTGDLIKVAKLKVERNKLGRLLVMLAATGRITRSGAGRGATLSLPGKTQARGNL